MRWWSDVIKLHTLNNGLIVEVVACYDGSMLEYYDFFDYKTGNCLNIGDPWYGEEPKKVEIENLFKEN